MNFGNIGSQLGKIHEAISQPGEKIAKSIQAFAGNLAKKDAPLAEHVGNVLQSRSVQQAGTLVKGAFSFSPIILLATGALHAYQAGKAVTSSSKNEVPIKAANSNPTPANIDSHSDIKELQKGINMLSQKITEKMTDDSVSIADKVQLSNILDLQDPPKSKEELDDANKEFARICGDQNPAEPSTNSKASVIGAHRENKQPQSKEKNIELKEERVVENPETLSESESEEKIDEINAKLEEEIRGLTSKETEDTVEISQKEKHEADYQFSEKEMEEAKSLKFNNPETKNIILEGGLGYDTKSVEKAREDFKNTKLKLPQNEAKEPDLADVNATPIAAKTPTFEHAKLSEELDARITKYEKDLEAPPKASSKLSSIIKSEKTPSIEEQLKSKRTEKSLLRAQEDSLHLKFALTGKDELKVRQDIQAQIDGVGAQIKDVDAEIITLQLKLKK